MNMPTTTPGRYRASASALLAVCVVTLVGVATGLDPDVILWRAVVSGIIVGITVTVVVRLLSAVLDNQ